MADFQAIVVGSGYGGAVTALRLGEAGVETLVLERGRRWTIEDPTSNATFATFEQPDGRAEWLKPYTADVLVEPARVNGRPGWIEPARELRAAADRALLAAQHRDVDGLSAASEGLLNACQQCHKTYWLPTAVSP